MVVAGMELDDDLCGRDYKSLLTSYEKILHKVTYRLDFFCQLALYNLH